MKIKLALILILKVLDRDLEGELRAYIWLRFSSYCSFELLKDHFRYGQTKAHSTAIDVLGSRNATEEMKELV
jgi:hypothetical protein